MAVNLESGKIFPIVLRKPQFGCGKKKKQIPREGIEEESKCHTYDRPPHLHLNINTVEPRLSGLVGTRRNGQH